MGQALAAQHCWRIEVQEGCEAVNAASTDVKKNLIQEAMGEETVAEEAPGEETVVAEEAPGEEAVVAEEAPGKETVVAEESPGDKTAAEAAEDAEAGEAGDIPELLRQAERLRERHEAAVDSGLQLGHAPVLFSSIMEVLFPSGSRPEGGTGGVYVDGTFGRGSFSAGILEQLSEDGRLYAFDIDRTALEVGRELEREDSRFTMFHRPYGDLAEALEGVSVNGVVLDVGVSSPQVDDKSRGFSLQHLQDGPDRPVDLRMNPDAGVSVAEWLEAASVEELAWVLDQNGDDFGETLLNERIAQAIMDDQKLNGPYTSMKRFAEVAGRALVWPEEEFQHSEIGLEHPAKLVVQALRVYINREKQQIRAGLEAAFKVLVMGGRCLISVFKRQEAAVIVDFIQDHEEPDAETIARLGRGRRLRELYPLVGTDLDYAVRLIGKPLRAPGYEVLRNPRARSGFLYVMEKVPRQTRRVKAKPRLHRNRFREPEPPSIM
mmetsp:Transcript_41962/g.129986  ORF Transcript_41962/g.129986 Transcript_41962/m.129986 type:complete len:490 (+) Transcript_41962:74-1543(+)